MRSQTAARFHVVKKDEKEGRLTEFVRQQIVAIEEGGARPREYLLVARSARSPAVRALLALSGDLARERIGVRAVLIEPAELAAGFCEVRQLSEVRVLEAHEQLVLGPATAWIGDCMRREPNERDAFEAYATECPLTATWALRSFEALWRRAVPIAPPGSDSPGELVAADLAAAALPAAADASTPPSAASRN